jgi:hypothetical protein
MPKLDSETRLRRKPLSTALTEEGYPVSAAALETFASRGGGPPYEKFGKYTLYPWGRALEWARRRRSPLAVTATEHRVAKACASAQPGGDEERTRRALPAAD